MCQSSLKQIRRLKYGNWATPFDVESYPGGRVDRSLESVRVPDCCEPEEIGAKLRLCEGDHLLIISLEVLLSIGGGKAGRIGNAGRTSGSAKNESSSVVCASSSWL